MTLIGKRISETVAYTLLAAGFGKESPPGHLVLSFSGGPDSSVLLDLLFPLSAGQDPRIPPFQLTCFYLNHHLRSESECAEEESLVRAVTGRYGCTVQAEILERDYLTNRAALEGLSLEEVAREERYRRLNRYLDMLPPPVFGATAHHNDDHLETLVARFFQGSSCAGLGGIPAVSERILRPLRDIPSEWIHRYAREKGLRYVVDASNRDTRFLRNRIRHELLPLAAEIFPGYRKALNRLAEDQASLGRFMDTLLPEWDNGGDETLACPVNRFLALDEPLRKRFLMAGANQLLGGRVRKGYRLPSRFFQKVVSAGRIPRKGVLLEGHGLKLESSPRPEGTILCLSLLRPEPPRFFYRLEPGVDWDWDGVTVSVRGSSSGEGGELCLARPLVCRSFLPGDRITVNGTTRRLKKSFAEWGIPEEQRALIPVFEGANGVVAVAAAPFGGKNYCSDRIKTAKYDDFSHPFLYIVVKRTGGYTSFYA